jgi:excisionase family DNA binding protein
MDISQTFNLAQAAKILKAHPETVRYKAKRGEIPARKVGRGWVFSELALQQYLMGELHPRVVQGDMREENTCHSSNAVQVKIGITGSTRREADERYKEVLAHRTGRRRRSSTIG